MALKQPESMDECVYFTQRAIGAGKAKAWVFKEKCPKCKKVMMGKPVEKGKVKTRAKEYTCPSCGFTEEKEEHEEICCRCFCNPCWPSGKQKITSGKRKRYIFVSNCR